MVSTFMNRGTRFSTLRDKKYGTFIYKFFQEWKHWLVELIAPVKNHEAYTTVRDEIINLLYTVFVYSCVCWLLSVSHPLRVGTSIAVISRVLQYYFEWYVGKYFKLKK